MTKIQGDKTQQVKRKKPLQFSLNSKLNLLEILLSAKEGSVTPICFTASD
jgi:hypothetical protein